MIKSAGLKLKIYSNLNYKQVVRFDNNSIESLEYMYFEGNVKRDIYGKGKFGFSEDITKHSTPNCFRRVVDSY